MPSETVKNNSIGPLSLQIGQFTNSVADLMNGFEHMAERVPEIAGGMVEMTQNVALINEALQDKVISVASTYGHLRAMTAEIPSLIAGVNTSYRRGLVESARFPGEPTDEELAALAAQEARVERIKAEMLAMAQERVVIGVLTRDIVHDANRSRRMLARQGGNGSDPAARQSRPSGTAQQSNRAPTTSGYRVIAPSSSSAAKKPAVPVTSLLADPLSQLIVIPQFVPTVAVAAQPAAAPAAKQTDPTARTAVPSSSNQHRPKFTNIQARAVTDDTEVLPNFRQDDGLPAHLRDLVVPRSDGLIFDKSNRPRKRRPKFDSFEPMARSLAKRNAQTEQRVADICDQLEDTKKKFEREKDKSFKRLRAVAANLEKKHHDKDDALLNSVGRVIKEAVDTFQDAVQDSDAFRLLKELAQNANTTALPQPQPSAEQRRQIHDIGGYRVISVSAKPPAAPKEPTTPVNIPVVPPKAPISQLPPQTKPAVPQRSLYPDARTVDIIVADDHTPLHWEPVALDPDPALTFDPRSDAVLTGQFGHNAIAPHMLRGQYDGARLNSPMHARDPRMALLPKHVTPPPAIDPRRAALFPESFTVSTGKALATRVGDAPLLGVERKELIVFDGGERDVPNSYIPPPDHAEALHFPFRDVQVLPTEETPATLVYPPTTSASHYPISNILFDHQDSLFDRLKRDGPYWLSRVATVRQEQPAAPKTDAPAPTAPVIAGAPPTIIVQVPQRSGGVERELVQLLHSVVETQQSAMQGNQALLLSLINSGGGNTCQYCAAGPEQEQPLAAEPTSEVVPYVEPAVEPVQQENRDPNSYNTALGQVVLEGELLNGPYRIQPKPHKAGPTGSGSSAVTTKFTVDPENALQGPRMRTIASDALLKQLNTPTAVPERPPVVLPLPTVDANAAVVALLTNLAAVPAQQQTSNEGIAKAVADGVQAGVKQALGFMDHSEGVTDRDAKRMHRSQQPQDSDGLLRIGSQPREARMVISHGREPRRDPVQLGADRDPLSAEALRQEVESSKRHAAALLERDTCCSFDDSLLLGAGEEQTARLGPERFNALYGQDESFLSTTSDASQLSGDTPQPHQTLYRSKLDKDRVELFGLDRVGNSDLPARRSPPTSRQLDDSALSTGTSAEEKWYDSASETASKAPSRVLNVSDRKAALSRANSRFMPLVSKVLRHSATEHIVRGDDRLTLQFSNKAAGGELSPNDTSIVSSDGEGVHLDSFASEPSEEMYAPHSRGGNYSVQPKLHVRSAANDRGSRPSSAAIELEEGSFDRDLDLSGATPHEEVEEEVVQDRAAFVRGMAERHSRFSAAGIERSSPMHASNNLPRQPAISNRRAVQQARKAGSGEDDVTERDARRINQQVAFKRNSDKLLLDPHQVISAQRGRSAATLASAKNKTQRPALQRDLAAGSSRDSGSSWSQLGDKSGSRLSASGSSCSSETVGSNTNSFSDQSTASDELPTKGPPSSNPQSADSLADQMMLELLGRQRTATVRSMQRQKQGRVAPPIQRLNNDIDAYHSASSSSDEGGDRSLLNVTGSTDSSVAPFTGGSRAPNKLLTVRPSAASNQQSTIQVSSSGAIKHKSWR